MRVVESNGQYRITIPKGLVKDKGWSAGTELRFVEDLDGNVFLKEI
jgi:bifunctional DNA-binding transcriptional regulator/antitoxin component of YhaV-PrlF toxin-antitoxin module